MKKLEIAFFDVDDTLIGGVWPRPPQPWHPPERRALGDILACLAEHDVTGIAVTGRPPGHLALLQPLLGGLYAVSEQGGSAWLCPFNRTITNPIFAEWSREVRPEVLRRLEPVLAREDVVLQPGGRQATICLYPSLPDAALGVSELYGECEDLLKGSGLPVELQRGLGVDLLPASPNLSKLTAFQWIEEELHSWLYGNPPRWEHVAFFEDSMTTSAPALDWLSDRGATLVGVPTGSNDAFRQAVRQRGGVIAPACGEKGVAAVLSQLLFRHSEKKPGR